MESKLVAWIGEGANQIALLNKLHSVSPLAAIVVERKKSQSKNSISKLFQKAYERLFLAAIDNAWKELQHNYRKDYPTLPKVDILEVENINDESVIEFTKKYSPRLVLVSGTRIIKKKMFAVTPSLGIVNLHTGLSPYIKGGPNCTNWCIANNELHLIGNTVMVLDEGIDSGNLIETSLIDFTGNETLLDVHTKVMNEAHQLYIGVIQNILKNNSISNTIQQNNITTGKTYYTKQWTLREKKNLIKNFKNFSTLVNGAEYTNRKEKLVLLKRA